MYQIFLNKSIKVPFLTLLFIAFTQSSFASNVEYVWVPSVGYYDHINNEEINADYLPTYFDKLPEIGSTVIIKKKNRLYKDLGLLLDINTRFIQLLKYEKCKKEKGAFTLFMLNKNDKKCSLDEVINQVKTKYNVIYYSYPYRVLDTEIRAKVLGYVSTYSGVFMSIEEKVNFIKKDKKWTN